ncbi:hypothetical protein EV175_001959 [Coemansia sp. RSA 1933]|nr:hypothetical protein EV175_001959 [Coemansia sp. RSA 1933]
MHTHHEAMVRRAVAQHIVQKVKHSRIAKRQRLMGMMPSAGISPAGSFADCAATAPDGDVSADGRSGALLGFSQSQRSSACGSHDTDTAIEALAAALSAVRTDRDDDDHFTPPTTTETAPSIESQLVQRIIELQQEKEYLLQVMMWQHQQQQKTS